MPVGNISWGKMSPKEQADYLARKAKANAIGNPTENVGITDAGVVPKPVSKPAGSTPVGFNSIKAYYTRSNRSIFSKK